MLHPFLCPASVQPILTTRVAPVERLAIARPSEGVPQRANPAAMFGVGQAAKAGRERSTIWSGLRVAGMTQIFGGTGGSRRQSASGLGCSWKGDRNGGERSSILTLRGLMAPGVMLPRFEQGTDLHATRLIANTPIGTPRDATGFRILPSRSRWTANSISCAFPRPLLWRCRFGRR